MLEIVDYKYIVANKDHTKVLCTDFRFRAEGEFGRSKIHYYSNYGQAYNAIIDHADKEALNEVDFLKVKITTEEVEDDSKYLENQAKKKVKEEQEKLEKEAKKTVLRNDLYELGILNDDGSIKDEYRNFFVEQIHRY